MFKILVLQKYYALSDETTEAQLKDRFSFMGFLGLRLGEEVPDANTIWDFKELIEKDKREGSQKLFEAFRRTLTGEDLVDQSDRAVLGDSAHHSEDHEEHLLKCDAEEFLMQKAYRNKPHFCGCGIGWKSVCPAYEPFRG